MAKQPKAAPRRGRPLTPKQKLTETGKILRGIRGDLRYAEVDEMLGVGVQWWHNRETGKVRVTTNDAAAICKVFGLVWVIIDGRNRVFPRSGFALPKH